METLADRLRQRFNRNELVSQALPRQRSAVVDFLQAKYGEAHRRYHTLSHIEDCLSVFEDFRHLSEDPAALELGIIFHDVYYDIGVPTRQNEERSAQALIEYITLLGSAKSERAYRAFSAVLATTHDHTPSTNDNKLMVDIDLAGLGAPWEAFLRNNQNVREEYAHVPEDKFREGNGAILRRFLERTPLYYHPEIEAAFGAQAKENLARWLNRP